MSRLGRYKMGTFSRLTGFSQAVLRAWERRHALLDPERLEGKHRLYTDDDLRVMRRVRRLLDAGHSIGEIARLGRDALLAAEPATIADRPPAAAAPEPATDVGRGARRLSALRGDLVQAAATVDRGLLRRRIDETFALVSPEVAIHQVLLPALVTIGERWASGEISVAGEHLVSSEVSFRLRKLLEVNLQHGARKPPVVCACFPDEQHEIGLLVVALWLAAAGQDIAYLGARVPLKDLERACEQLKPETVCLSVTDPALLRALLPPFVAFCERWTPRLRIHVGGAGVIDAPAEIERAGAVLWPPGSQVDELLADLAAFAPRAVAGR